MRIAGRVTQERAEAQASRIERLKERLERERALELQEEIRRAREDAASVEAARVLPRSWR